MNVLGKVAPIEVPTITGDRETGTQATTQLNSAAVPEAVSYSILTSKRAIEAFMPWIVELLTKTRQIIDVTVDPEYFLEKNELRSSPVVVLIRHGEQLSAVLYGKERKMFGIKTGVIECGDHCGDGVVIAAPHFRALAVAAGVLKMLEIPRVHTVRLSLKITDDNEIVGIKNLAEKAGLKSTILSEAVHNKLVLESTLDGFLSRLGSHTRRNLRVYRRRVEQKRWKFIARLDPSAAAAAVRALQQQQGRHKSSVYYLNCCQEALNRVPGSFYAGITTATGEWASLAGGWLRQDRYYMLIQLNDARFTRDSVSAVMRSYLIEYLIGSRVKSICFVGGSSELLGRFCVPERCAHHLFEKSVLSAARRSIGTAFFRKSLVSRIQRGQPGPGAIT